MFSHAWNQHKALGDIQAPTSFNSLYTFQFVLFIKIPPYVYRAGDIF